MATNRAKNALRNLIYGALLRVYALLVPFGVRTCLIYCMGAEYAGLGGLFASVLSVLNLAELGVGSAMTFCLYKPLAQKDHATVCALLRLYQRYYRIIGVVVAVLGLALLPVIPLLIQGTVPEDVSIYVLYGMNLAMAVISYWLFAHKACLLNACQRNDVLSKVSLGVNTLVYALQLAAILLLQNYYAFAAAMLLGQALSSILTARMAARMYPHLKPQGRLPKDQVQRINHKIRDLFTSKFGAVVLNSVDALVISAFLGLSALAIYQNYFYLVAAASGVVGLLFSSARAGIGDSLATESGQKNYQDLTKLTILVTWIAGVGACCIACLTQPFMRLWMGEDLMLDNVAVVLFCIYFYTLQINTLVNVYKDAAGIWRSDRFRPLVVSLVNFGLNLLMVQWWGIYGVLASTLVATLCVNWPWLFSNVFAHVFGGEFLRGYLLLVAKMTAVVLLAVFVCWLACSFTDSLLLRLPLCLVMSNCIIFPLIRPEKIAAALFRKQ